MFTSPWVRQIGGEERQDAYLPFHAIIASRNVKENCTMYLVG